MKSYEIIYKIYNILYIARSEKCYKKLNNLL